MNHKRLGRTEPTRRRTRLAAAAGLLWAQLAAAQTPAGLDAQRWLEVDRHALSAPAEVEKDPAALARWLTSPFDATPAKLRAIYRWIADRIDYDVQAYLEGRYSNEAPQEVLARRQSVCEGYASLFSDLSRHAGLQEVRTITGYVKDERHLGGAAFDRPNHAWIAARIDGQWRLIDPTWGAGYASGTRYVKRFEPMYFLADPEHLRFSHFAQEADLRFHAQTPAIEAFSALPPAPRTLLSVVDRPLLDKLPTEWPRTFEHEPGTFWIDEAPMTATLDAGTPVRFRLRSDKLTEFALMNGSAWTFEPVRPDGSTLATTPTPGPLVVLGKAQGDTDYRYLLQYDVRSQADH